MKYQSIPRTLINWIVLVYKYLKEEFGNWAYLIIGAVILFAYKPVLNVFDKFSSYVLYGFLALIVLSILYWFIRKIFRF